MATDSGDSYIPTWSMPLNQANKTRKS